MFVLSELPYSYDAFEPFIDEETMHIHHDKHHAGYVDNLNKLVSGNEKLEALLASDNQKIKNNAGGHANHSMFWQIMGPKGNTEPEGVLMDAIKNSFTDFPTFQEKFSQAGIGRFGSGWVWLILENGKLAITDTANQDTPISEGKTPILCLDVWEHAYYLKYKNMRADYIKAWWNVVNWKKIEENYGEVVRLK